MTIAYKGTTLYYRIAGTGPVLVLLHGFLENSSMWDALLPELTKAYQVVTIDLPGHGQTPCKGYVHTMEDMAGAVEYVLSFLKIDQAIMIGHSMGGYVSLAFAELFPNRLSGLLLLNSTSKADSVERRENRDRGILVVKKNPKAYTSMAITNLFAPENQERFTSQITHIMQEASKTPLQGIIAAQEGMKIRKDRTHILKNFKGKKLLLAGKKDPVLAYQELVKEAELCNLPLIDLEGGHMSHVESFDAVLEALLSLRIT